MTDKEYMQGLRTVALSVAVMCAKVAEDAEKGQKAEIVSALAELINAAQTLRI